MHENVQLVTFSDNNSVPSGFQYGTYEIQHGSHHVLLSLQDVYERKSRAAREIRNPVHGLRPLGGW